MRQLNVKQCVALYFSARAAVTCRTHLYTSGCRRNACDTKFHTVWSDHVKLVDHQSEAHPADSVFIGIPSWVSQFWSVCLFRSSLTCCNRDYPHNLLEYRYLRWLEGLMKSNLTCQGRRMIWLRVNESPDGLNITNLPVLWQVFLQRFARIVVWEEKNSSQIYLEQSEASHYCSLRTDDIGGELEDFPDCGGQRFRSL